MEAAVLPRYGSILQQSGIRIKDQNRKIHRAILLILARLYFPGQTARGGIRMTYESNHLEHFGIKGQHWGVRRFQEEDGTLTPAGRERYGAGSESSGSDSNETKTSIYVRADGTKDHKRIAKDAKKDAEEYARAQAYYGKGAGTRRKQIKNKISERQKDPDYKKQFEENLSKQDMSEHQKAANRERKMNDTKDFAAKTARGVKNFILGAGTASATAIALVNIARATGADQVIKDYGNKVLDSIRNRRPGNYGGYRWN